jgi:hypothetical protein
MRTHNEIFGPVNMPQPCIGVPDAVQLELVSLRCSELEAELATLREQVRWRKWPGEKPLENGYYLVRYHSVGAQPQHGVMLWSRGVFSFPSVTTHWRPLGPLPEQTGTVEEKT